MSTPVILPPGQGACPRPGEITLPLLRLPPVALRLPGLQVHHRLPFCSPGKALAPRPGEIAPRPLRLPPVALRLPGLQVHRRLPFCSPGKALAPRPGEITLRPFQVSPGRAALTGATIPCDFYATPSSHFCAGVRRLAVSGVSQRC